MLVSGTSLTGCWWAVWFCVALRSRRDRAGVTAAGAGGFVQVALVLARVVLV